MSSAFFINSLFSHAMSLLLCSNSWHDIVYTLSSYIFLFYLPRPSRRTDWDGQLGKSAFCGVPQSNMLRSR